MSTLTPRRLKEHFISQVIESISETSNNVYYAIASRSYPFSNNDSVPTPQDNFLELDVDVYEEGIFGKKINSTDINFVIPRVQWTTNTVYTAYDHDDGDLFNKQFYVYVDGGSTYYVYKCLDNNGNTASNTQPSDTSESACNFVTTSDGYTWKLMYTAPEATFEKFLTSTYMPVFNSANVAGNSTPGAIDVIRVVTKGSNYIATLSGQFNVDDVRELIPTVSGNTLTYRLPANASSNTDFYTNSAIYITSGTGAGQLKSIVDYDALNRVITVNSAFTIPPSSDSAYLISPNIIITGDGTGAAAYATVTSNSTVNNFISKINIVSRGSGYTYSSAVVTGNTGSSSNNATVKVIIPPKNGHGYNSITELGSTTFTISTEFAGSESGYITTENDFRKVVLLKDPLFSRVTMTLQNEIGTFVNGETVYQVDTKQLNGIIQCNTSSNNIVGTSTDFTNSFKAGDHIILTEPVSNTSCIRTVQSITNSTFAAINSPAPFVTSFATHKHASVLCQGVKSGNASPYIQLTNVEPKFVTGKTIIGVSSGAVANVNAIAINEKPYNNWNTLDNRVRISYSNNIGTIPEDSQVYQTDSSISNAYFHSANNTFIFLVRERGIINANPFQRLEMQVGTNNYTLGSVKYSPDILKGTGEVIYIENTNAISRDTNQTEKIKITINL